MTAATNNIPQSKLVTSMASFMIVISVIMTLWNIFLTSGMDATNITTANAAWDHPVSPAVDMRDVAEGGNMKTVDRDHAVNTASTRTTDGVFNDQHTGIGEQADPQMDEQQEQQHDRPILFPKPEPAQRYFSLKNVTETGVDVSDPQLYLGEDLHGDSSTATVMGMATKYPLEVFHRFVGTLRKSGFKGNIILGVGPDIDPLVIDYLKSRDVTVKSFEWVKCEYEEGSEGIKLLAKRKTCIPPFNDIKSRWSRFPLQKMWLEECETCTGPVLTIDVRDTYFQLDPFGPGSPKVEGLQVFEEHKKQTTNHWMVNKPIRLCKNTTHEGTMLCSGSTIGTRKAMLKYFEVMYEEMKVWIKVAKCRFDFDGDDQTMHNHLYYSGQLPFATPIAYRAGGIIITPGSAGKSISGKKNVYYQKTLNVPLQDAKAMPFLNATEDRWLGPKDLIDDEGYFVEYDGSRSRVVHQFDRFGFALDRWLDRKGFSSDPDPMGKRV